MEELKEILAPEYSEEEAAERTRILQELSNSANQRSQSYAEFDDMTYNQWYLANKLAGGGYIKPRLNKSDLSVTTGITREKCNTVVTALLRYNFVNSIEAYDEGSLPDRAVGRGLEALVKKSRDLECPDYESKRSDTYTEFVQQGNVFMLETWVEEEEIRKEINSKKVSVEDIKKIDWTEKVVNVKKYCNTVMIPGINVFLGDIRQKYMENQPYYSIRREISYAQAKAEYGKWERFKNVPISKVVIINGKSADTHYWTMDANTVKNKVEEVRYYNHFLNCYQVFLNGVMMLPVGFPVEFMLGINTPNLIKADGESMGANFAYCRGISAKNKFNQAVVDEFYRLILFKFRKSVTPPLANNTGKMLNDSINMPGTLHKGIDVEKLMPIGVNNSLTDAEYRIFEMVKEIINISSVSPIFEGNATRGEQTAREISELKTQSLMKLGMIIVGIILMEQKMVRLRMYDLLKHWTEDIDKSIEGVRGELLYKREVVDEQLENGITGKHMVELSGSGIPSGEQLRSEEDILSEKYGVPVRKTIINVKNLLTIKWRFFVTVTPSEKDRSELNNLVEEEGIAKVAGLLQPGILPQEINRDYVKERAAQRYKLDPKKLFVQGAPAMPGIPENPAQQQTPSNPAGMPGGVSAVSAQGLPSGQRKPSLTQLLKK